MRFAGNELRKAYYVTLTGAITYDSNVVKVFDTQAPTNEPTPYIILSTHNQVGNNGSKSKFGSQNTINIHIIDSSVDDAVSRVATDSITNQILQTVRPDTETINLTMDNFYCTTLNLSGSYDTFLDTDDTNTFRQILLIEHNLNEL